MPRLKPLDQQVVVLAGASSGVGRESALLFASRGARIVAAARDEPALRSLVEEIEREGGEVTARTVEVANFADVEQLARTRSLATAGSTRGCS